MATELATVVRQSFPESHARRAKRKTVIDCKLVKRASDQAKFQTLHERRKEWAKAFAIKPSPEVVAITVKPEEEQAVLDRLQNLDIYSGRHRTYQIGQIYRTDDSTLSVAVVRPSEQGVGSAQDVTRDAIEDLDPKLIALVGIGGGKPAPEYGLGDVIVCTRVRDLTMGAYVWDPIRAVSTRQLVDSGGPMAKRIENLITTLNGLKKELDGWNSRQSLRHAQPAVSVDARNFYGEQHVPDIKKVIAERFTGRNVRKKPIFYTGPIVSDGRLVNKRRKSY